ncbi:MAG: hypothetical protein ACLUVB_06670 [Acutalibacteraceae bacterium]
MQSIPNAARLLPHTARRFGIAFRPDSEGLGEIDYLLDDLTLEADVTDCTVPDFLFAAAPSMESLELDGDSLSGEMAELQDATQQLQDGAGALDEAVSALEGKLGEFAAGYAQFDAGVDAALSGTQALAQGGENLLENADLLSDKSGELAAGAGRLNAGAAELSGLLNTQLVPGLVQAQAQEAALREKMNALSGALDGVSIPDVSGLRDQLSAGAGRCLTARLPARLLCGRKHGLRRAWGLQAHRQQSARRCAGDAPRRRRRRLPSRLRPRYRASTRAIWRRFCRAVSTAARSMRIR